MPRAPPPRDFSLLLELRAGEGGDDAKAFVHELCGAYASYAESRRLSAELLERSAGSATLRISGPGAWSVFQHEPGKHVVQRVPPSEKRGRRHTSTITVAVLPLLDDSSSVPLPDSEVRTKSQGGHGKGGQHQNKRDSAIRMVHEPTGLSVFINGRDQHRNRRLARQILTQRVNAERARAQHDQRAGLRRRQVGGGDRSGKVRSYNFIDRRVVDHRRGTRTSDIRGVMRGRFELLAS